MSDSNSLARGGRVISGVLSPTAGPTAALGSLAAQPPVSSSQRPESVTELCTSLGHWFAQDRAEREGGSGLSVDDVEELKRLRSENAKLRMERDVLKRSVVLWVNEATK